MRCFNLVGRLDGPKIKSLDNVLALGIFEKKELPKSPSTKKQTASTVETSDILNRYTNNSFNSVSDWQDVNV